MSLYFKLKNPIETRLNKEPFHSYQFAKEQIMYFRGVNSKFENYC